MPISELLSLGIIIFPSNRCHRCHSASGHCLSNTAFFINLDCCDSVTPRPAQNISSQGPRTKFKAWIVNCRFGVTSRLRTQWKLLAFYWLPFFVLGSRSVHNYNCLDTLFYWTADRDQSCFRGATRSSDRGSVFAARGPITSITDFNCEKMRFHRLSWGRPTSRL